MDRITFLLLLVFAVDCPGQAINKGPEGRAIICLTYDDGITSQLYTAIPQLDSLGMKATFFLNSIKGWTEEFGIGEPVILGWKRAAQTGHELGNHTLFHPCPQAIGWQPELSIEGYTLEQLLKEIETANQYLDALDQGGKRRAFAFPCNNTVVEGQEYSQKLREKGLAKYARSGSDRSSIITDFRTLNPMKVPSWHVEGGTTLEELIAFAREVKAKGKMGVYQFHGIGSPLFNVSPATHRQFLDYLKAHEADYWVATFSDAMDYATRR